MPIGRLQCIDEAQRDILTRFLQIVRESVINILTGARSWHDRLAAHALPELETRARKLAK